MSRPRVSVVIDNYNYGRFLPQALDSVLSQDFPSQDLEVIVADDGSTDDSRDVLKRYAPRVKALLQENQGQATAFNNGIQAAQGDIVCLLDSDDVWLPGKLKDITARFDADPSLGVVQHLLQESDSALKPLPQTFPAWGPDLSLDEFLDGRAQFTATSALAFRRDVLLKALPIPKDLFYYLDDYLTVHTLFLAKGGNIPKVLGLHRIHGDNFCAEGYRNVKKLAADFENRRIFRTSLEGWMTRYGRRLTPRYERLEGLELMRRAVLYHMLEGRRGQAAAAWGRGLFRHGRSAFGLFRVATCALALLSPALYYAVYESYAQAGPLKTLRSLFLPA